MARFYPSGGAGGGSGSDECTATKAELMKGYTAILSDSGDEPAEGTLELTGNAQAGHVLAGETFYTTNPKQKQTGRMTVNSLLSFSVAVSSGRRVTATWKNPKAASGKPYSGVVIRYSTSGYPGKTGGTQIYKGAGNNTVSEGMSSASFDMPALNTTYYFSIYPYVTCSSGEMTGNQLNASVKTGGKITKTFTASGSLTIQGYSKMDVFLVGGGGGGGYSGGGGGRTTTKLGIPIASGDTIAITVGAGGGAYSNGGASSVSKNGALQASAAGGSGAANSYGASGGAGGSGGGANDRFNGKPGGSDGGNGINAEDIYNCFGGAGQTTTTRAWGQSSGTLYAGGGGGGCHGYRNENNDGDVVYYYGEGGNGGAGGGGNGGGWTGPSHSIQPIQAVVGAVNTGGGGGGRASSDWGTYNPGNGGSGIVLIKLY